MAFDLKSLDRERQRADGRTWSSGANCYFASARTHEASELRGRLQFTKRAESTSREERDRLLDELEEERVERRRLQDQLEESRRPWWCRLVGRRG